MDAATFLGLVQNTALLLAVAFIFDVVASRWRAGQSLFQQAPVGLAIGAIGVTIMMTPWTFMPGIIFDTRSVLIGISGLFFGSLSAAIAMIMTAMFRFYQGGIGAWTGIAVILSSGLIGIAWRHFHRRPLAELTWRELYLFGMAIHLAMLGMMLTLPWVTALRVLSSITLPVILIYPLATALLGVLMVNRLRHKQVDGALRESEERYRTLIENAGDIIFKTDATGHFTFVNQAGSRITGYEEKEVIGKEYWALVRPDMREDAIKFFGRQFVKGLQNTYSEFPIITKDGREIWLGQNTSLLVEGDHVSGFQAMARNINDRKRAEKQLEDTLEKLRRAVGATIQVMASAVEARDPYTAGHQIRSANLARAIAIEMGLAQEKIEGIRIAGSIHDIGKLSIPAEILSKPTKLSELEFSLIKEHAARGFEMLKDVESPWPLAEIVYQHHERMDGSGYPRNLKGEEICIEARILTVADVVEAMASHRPYRPGLGIDAALNEIEKNRGIFYDDDVAGACLRLFRERGFKLEGT